MSGPKTSKYTLTAEQRRILMEQRKIQMEKGILRKRMEKTRNSISREVSAVDSRLREMESVLKETGDGEHLLQDLKTARDQAMKMAVQSKKFMREERLEHLRKHAGELQEIYKKLQKKINNAEVEYVKKEKEFRQRMQEDIEIGFQSFFYQITEQEDEMEACKEKIRNDLKKVETMHVTEDMKQKWKQMKCSIEDMEDAEFLKHYYEITVRPFTKQCTEHEEFYQKMGTEFQKIKDTYEVLCDELGVRAEEIFCSPEGMESLKKNVHELEMQVMQNEEEEYISECIDEAMKEMGYQLVGEAFEKKQRGRKITKELYLFDEGTAVSVTYGNNGQITMELGGMDEEDRIPTDAECRQLTQDMHGFCDDYYEIEKRLRKKGIVTKNINILPAESKYAQIINISNYEMKEKVSLYETGCKKHAMKEKKALCRGE